MLCLSGWYRYRYSLLVLASKETNKNVIGQSHKRCVCLWNYANLLEFGVLCCYQNAAHPVLFLFLCTLFCFAFPTIMAMFRFTPVPLLSCGLLLWDLQGASGKAAYCKVQAVSVPASCRGTFPLGLAASFLGLDHQLHGHLCSLLFLSSNFREIYSDIEKTGFREFSPLMSPTW